jgi:uncharacterized membrane protein
VTEVGDSKNSGEVRIELCAHNSLTPRQARWFLVTVAVGPVMTAGFCLLQGFWPVLPFAGLELGLLYLMHHGRFNPDFVWEHWCKC